MISLANKQDPVWKHADLVGVLLTGGVSRRMGEDKALLSYHGQTELDRCYGLLSAVCDQVFVSVSSANANDIARKKYPILLDASDCGAKGPLAGIITALNKFEHKAVLVIACDLPHLDLHTLIHLLENRDHGKLATAYHSQYDGLPEPLCAIWETDILQLEIDFAKTCPRKILLNQNIRLLELPNKQALDNFNTPAERERFCHEG